VVSALTRVEIPVVVLEYAAERLVGWKAAQQHWRLSAYTDHQVWGPYAFLGTSGRFPFRRDEAKSAYRFNEAHTVLWLEQQEGFVCWSRVQLFRYGKNLRDGLARTNTNEVRALWRDSGWPWPDEVQTSLAAPPGWPVGKSYRPRNPDVVAYHPLRKEWRFAEVKGWTENVDQDQLTALGVLHLLTGAPVALVRLLQQGRRTKATRPDRTPANIRYNLGADLGWALHRGVLPL
jgi:hypothetical protein